MPRFFITACLLCCSCIMFTGKTLYAQSVITTATIQLNITNQPIEQVFSLIEKQTGYRFAYNTDLPELKKRVSYTSGPISLTALLKILLQGTDITYNIIGNQIVLQNNNSADKIVVNGYVKDASTGEFLIGAGVYLPEQKTGTVSNSYGFYALTVPRNTNLEMQVSYVGYRTEDRKLNATRNTAMNIGLMARQDSVLSHVVVTDDKSSENLRLNQLGLVDLSTDMLTNAPSVSGTGDVISSVEMQPGVHAGMEGTPGFFVRGGNAGQNLIQLDEATLYNPSHLFELVSIFNGAVIKRASLLKGGFPASYGDHVSSVLDIAMNDGSNEHFGGVVQAGSIVSGLTLYGPLKKKKASFLVSARRSMLDYLLQAFNVKSNYYSNYAFYDVNAKVNWQFSERDRILLSYYKGQDRNTFQDQPDDTTSITYGNKFGNEVFALRWNHLFSKRLFANTSVMYNNYYQLLSALQDDYFAQLYSGIRDINAKVDFYYYPSQAHRIKGGINFLRQQLFPATFSNKIPPSGNINNIKPDEIPEHLTARVAAYLSDEIRFNNRLNLYLGVRAPVFYSDSIRYTDIEPRVSLRYLISPATSIKLSYTQMHQYIHLVQSYNSSFPAEIWIGSNSMVKPQSAQQYSLGLFNNFSNNSFQASVEVYYKTMENQLLFKGGTTPAVDVNLDDNLIFGKGRSYGAEFFLKKRKGRLTGWLGYSLAYAYQQFDSLNLGREFPFAYDRRHSFYLTGAYTFNKHWRAAANFFAASGRAFTIQTLTTNPPGSTGGNPLYDDDNGSGGGGVPTQTLEVNNYRLAPYDRLDLSLSYKLVKETRTGSREAEWTLSVYNVYAQNNVFFAYRAIDPSTHQAVVKQVSFIPVIPTLSFRYKF